MRSFPNLSIGFFVALFIAAAAFQGARLDHERDAQEFFRWVLSASDHLGREGYIVPTDVLADFPNLIDDEFFDEVSAKLEPFVADLPEAAQSEEEESAQPAIVNVVRNTGSEEPINPEVWHALRSPELAEVREQFTEYRRQDQLYTAATRVGVNDLYSDQNVTASLSNMFFGFRKMAANLLWLKCDQYFHSGENHLMIPTIRTVVALDPLFVDAYLIGAWHLSYNVPAKLRPTPEAQKVWSDKYQAYVGARESFIYEGVDLLKSGIKNNPRNYKLYFDLGFAIYEEKLQDHANAVKYLSEAVRYRHEPFVARSLYRALMFNGQLEESKAGWEGYLKTYDPNFIHANRFIQYCEAQMAEREGDKFHQLYLEASERGDDAAADAAKAQMSMHYDEARSIWQNVIDEWGTDPLGDSRLNAMRAREYIDEERYYEAVALLEQARTETPMEYYQHFSDLIIEVKLAGNIDLNFSEQKELLRREDARLAKLAREAETAERATAGQQGQVAAAEGERSRLSLPMLLLGLIAVGGLGYAAYTILRAEA